LTYHRVGKELPGGFAEPGLWVTSSTLEMHFQQLKNEFHVVPLATLLNASANDEKLCSVTFDDGWNDTYEVAFPLLKKYEIPATVFVPVGLIGKSNCFWFESLVDLADKTAKRGLELQFVEYFNMIIPAWNKKILNQNSLSNLLLLLKRMPADNLDNLMKEGYRALNINPDLKRLVIDWDEISEMNEHNVRFAPHGSGHFILPNLSSDLKREEIITPLGIFRENGISAEPIFSYPNGDWDEDSIEYLKEAGYKGAVTTRLGGNTYRTNPYLLNRIDIHDQISATPGLFWFRIYQGMVSRESPSNKD
jgi:peptidoglycan/xylan/chitin deacetylase (PgdA/CDA1 family)